MMAHADHSWPDDATRTAVVVLRWAAQPDAAVPQGSLRHAVGLVRSQDAAALLRGYMRCAVGSGHPCRGPGVTGSAG
jgi:hypothetical protein